MCWFDTLLFKRFRRWRATFFCVAKRKWRKEKATLAAAKARSKTCVQGDSATRSSLPLLAQTLLVLKPWPPIFERLAAKGWGVIVGLTKRSNASTCYVAEFLFTLYFEVNKKRVVVWRYLILLTSAIISYGLCSL